MEDTVYIIYSKYPNKDFLIHGVCVSPEDAMKFINEHETDKVNLYYLESEITRYDDM